ncbi:MAG: efflux RND transporter periplasmic adaptor subunit [Deltaproteobacteria bacterium]|nr:efflux RND transporter periplasmic adaptor subunit [Deltaproteobacteria bacterium]
MIRSFCFGMCLLFVLTGCGDETVASKENRQAREGTTGKKEHLVNVKLVNTQPPSGEIEVVGALVAYLKVKISNEIGGMVEQLNFEKGERVKKGDLLAEIGSSSLRLQIQEATAARDAAKSNLSKMERGSRPQEIQIATAAVAEAEAALSEAEKNFKRIDRLHEIRAVSNSAYDAAERQMSTAKARMASAKQRLELAKKGPRIEDVNAARAQSGQAEAALALAEDRYRKSIIRTPITGTIAYRDVEVGEVIPAGTPITSVIGLDRLKIKLSLNERDLHILSNKKNFDFTVDAIPDETFRAQVFFVSPTAEKDTRFFPMEMVVENPDPRMADGMTARVKLPIISKKKSIKIPSNWLAEQNGKVGLFVVDNGKALFKPVRLGSYYDNRVEILSGLEDREQVVTNPAGLRNGDPVDTTAR